jgi:hypothetical protein
MQIKVWNDGDFTWRERFKNKEIVIEPHSFIWMNRDEAVDFAGKFAVPKLDTNRQIVPESQKRIRLEKAHGPHLYEKTQGSGKFVCQADGREFPTQEALDAYVRSNWVGALEDKDSINEPQKRGRGRPPKNAVSEGV